MSDRSSQQRHETPASGTDHPRQPTRAPAPPDAWLDGDDPALVPEAVRQAFPQLDRGPIGLRPLSGGLLHQSFHLRVGDVEYVLQRVSDVFAPEIHDNIQAVTAHLAAHGLPAAPLLPTRQGELSVELGALGRWRLMPHLGGVAFDTLQSTEQARSAGALVGRFHAALRDFRAPLAPMGIPYRDTSRVLRTLRAALESHRSHRLAAEVTPLGIRVLEAFESIGSAPDVPLRVIHGDLKLSNLLFESAEGPGRERAFALVDLDTLMQGTLWMELGDAWRSWCNPAGEDAAEVGFEMDFFEASVRGFREGHADVLSQGECDSLDTAPERLALELCARFVTDALEECYFGWDSARFPGRGEHNARRAFGQWRLYESAAETREERAAILVANLTR
jgi:Ser/Thr protein kinase RdoA (MazF antagonist)